MTEYFRSSDDYDEQAHELYSEGQYEEALELLREGIAVHPQAVELRVALGFAQLSRDQYAWSRQAFEIGLVLDPENEDALAGMGEVLLALGEVELAFDHFRRIIELGYGDDLELMLQVGRALFREGFFVEAQRFFEAAREHHSESAELTASLGYTAHRLGLEADAFYWLRRALALEPLYPEPRLYLANILYDRGENGAALHHYSRLTPDDHLDDLGVWRTVELMRGAYNLSDSDPELSPWFLRLAELSYPVSPDDRLLEEIESMHPDGTMLDPHQLELFGTLMRDVPEMLKRPSGEPPAHSIETLDGLKLQGTWDELLFQLQAIEGAWPGGTVTEFMQSFAQRGQAETGVRIPLSSAEAFLRGLAEAGAIALLERLVRRRVRRFEHHGRKPGAQVMNRTAPRTRPPVDPALRAAIESRHHPKTPGAASNALTFAWRALLKIKHTPEQLFDVIVTPVMFTVMFTFLFGGALAGSPREYLQFLLPGILVQTVTFTSVYTGFTLNTDLSKGIFDRFRSMPVWRLSPIVGAMLGDLVRFTVSSIIVFVIGYFLGYRPGTGLVGIVAAVVLLDLFAFGIGWIFTTLAMAVRTPSTVMTMSWLVLMPLTFASNIFVDPATMPGWLRAFVDVNPVSLLVTAVRNIMDGTVTGGEIGLSLLAPALVTLVCAPIALWLYGRKQ